MKSIKENDLPSSLEPSTILGIYHLKRIWMKMKLDSQGASNLENNHREWALDMTVLDQLGVGLEEAIREIYLGLNNFSDFENWILEKNGNNIPAYRIKTINQLFKDAPINKNEEIESQILSKQELDFFDKNGYVIIREAVSKKNCKAVEELIWSHLNMDKNDPSTWYGHHKDKQGIMVQLFQSEALDRNRFSIKIRGAFEQLWQSEKLFVSNDRVSFNPPQTENWHFQGPHMHWDVSLKPPIPFGLQGLLYLTDTMVDQGAFRLVPGFHHEIDGWLKKLAKSVNPRETDFNSLEVRPLAGKAGDFIIWHHALPHGSGVNTTDKPRIVQYINWLKIDRGVNPNWV